MRGRFQLSAISLCLAVLPLCLALSCGVVGAQSKPDSISGRIVLDDGQPAARAMVEITSVGLRSNREQNVECDETGSFKLSGLAPGSYSVTAVAPGYVSAEDASVQQYRPGESVTLRLVKGGVITGRVTDISGEPLVGTNVKVQRLRDLNGKRVRNGESWGWNDDWHTDDRGIYRVYGLMPGIYLVSVESGSGIRWYGAVDNETPTYYPSTTRDAAMEITVRPGDEISGIDIRLRNDAGRAVSGTLVGTTDASQPMNQPGITLLSATTREIVSSWPVYRSQTFAFFGIPDGEYELYARLSGSKEESGAGSAPQRVSVKGADVTGLTVRMTAYGSISGRVVVEPAKAGEAKCAPQPTNTIEEILVRAQSERRNPRSLNALLGDLDERADRPIAPSEKGEFTLRSLEPDSYRIEPDLPGDSWFVRSMSLPPSGTAKTRTDAARAPISVKAGEKVTGLELTLAEGAASLSGRVVPQETSPRGTSPLNLRIHLIPAEPTAADDVLRYRELVTEKDGSFAFNHLAPGKYRLLPRSIPDTEKEKPRPAAFDSTERIKLRKEAEAANNELELKPCQRVKEYVLRP